MKILLNVATELLARSLDWTECEGVRLVEQADGSFNLEMARDLTAARHSDETRAKAEADIRKLLAKEGAS